jgi:undecaprenyl-diphosphatase
MAYRRFVGYDTLGAALWTVTFVLLGYALGASWRVAERWVGRVGLLAGVVVAIVGLVLWFRRRRARA